MNEREADLRILRACAQAVHLEPGDDLCPDLEAIANGDGTAPEKVQRFGNQLVENVRERRVPA